MFWLMTTYDFERSFGFVLYEAARLLSKRFDQRAKGLGLTRAQCLVLVHLAQREGINQATLAERLELEPISLARCLDRMEQSDWIERRPDPGDRRAHLLYMSAKAKPLFENVLAVGTTVRAEALAGLPADTRELLVDLLLRVRDNLSDKSPAERALQQAGVA
jgi:DNA-binding MarR family transcriptional regulator